MNKKILLVAAAVLLLGVGGYFYTKTQKSGGNGGKSEVSSGMKSLKDLLSSGVAQKCTFSTTDESGVSEGTTYVAGGKVRGDFTTTASGKKTASHTIVDGKTSYIWTDGEKNGFKMTVEETEAGAEDKDAPVPQETSVQETDLNQKTDYKCSAWVPDSSLFVPPTNVTFTDFSEMFKPSASPGAQGGNSSQCAYCDSLSGGDKTQCLSALNCN